MGRLLLSKAARQRYELASMRAGAVCASMHLSANFLTCLSVVMAGGAALLLATERFFWAILAGIVSGVLDVLDGATARATGTSSRFGTVLDRTADRLNEMLFVLGILLSGRVQPALVLLAYFGLISPSYVRAVAESVGGVPDCEVGLAGRLEKFVILFLGTLGEGLFPEFRPLDWALVLVTVIGVVTALQRLLHARAVALHGAGHAGERP